MKQTTPGGSAGTLIVAIVAIITVIGLVFVWKTGVWRECRAEGHSFGYCWSLISR